MTRSKSNSNNRNSEQNRQQHNERSGESNTSNSSSNSNSNAKQNPGAKQNSNAKQNSGAKQNSDANRNAANSKQNSGSSRSNSKKKTSSYRYENLERHRPHLSRDNAAPRTTNSSNVNKRKSTYSPKKDPNAKLKIIPLGGLDAIGKNMTVFECGNDMIIDDAGLMFPNDDQPGIDLILPDYTYVLENSHKLRGIVITHGHEDHIGALPYLIKDLDCNVPIYATKLTIGFIQSKLEEHNIKNVKYLEINPGDQIRLSHMTVDCFSVNHSIPDAVGLFIQSPAGNVLHTGDIKLDQTPIDGVRTDFAALTRFGEIGVDLMMSDSTNAAKPDFTPSEAVVGRALRPIIANAQGRVIIASFASHIHRLQQICDAAVENGRNVVVTGRSMVQYIDIARRLGYLNISDDDLIDAYELNDIPADKVVVMCTGSQGEPLSALARIANGEHRTITIDEEDTVIISATPVPGNEKAVTRVINKLAEIGADVYDKSRACVHVSGHGGSEELKIVLSMVKPKAFMPVHGEELHLHAHAKLAQAVGIPSDKIFILDNGDSLVLSTKGIEQGPSVQSGIVYVDGLSVGDTSQDILDERCSLASQGFLSVALAVSFQSNKLLCTPQVELHGMPGSDDSYLTDEILKVITDAVNRCLNKGGSYSEVRKVVRDTARSLLWDRTKQRPMIIISLLEV